MDKFYLSFYINKNGKKSVPKNQLGTQKDCPVLQPQADYTGYTTAERIYAPSKKSKLKLIDNRSRETTNRHLYVTSE